MKKITAVFGLLIIIALFPVSTYAMDYTIDQMKIDAFLQKDGTANVEELQTYSFDGKFNGIKRTLIPKKGTEITHVKATENGKKLKVKQHDNEYKIYRKGKDEQITIKATYQINDGVQLYSDLGQFYWPFFDESNESDYEQLDVYIHPPQATNKTIAYGEDAAWNTETISSDGVVHYAMGKVPEGTNGNIRAAYDAKLFPEAALTENRPIKDEIISAKKVLQEKQDVFDKRQVFWADLGPYVTSLLVIGFLMLLFAAWRKRNSMQLEVERRFQTAFFIPEQDMSLPATIFFMRSGMAGTEVLTAALMDLLRKGYIKKQEDTETFAVIHRNTDHKYEQQLIHWLFDTVGKNGLFRLDDLARYTKVTANQSSYQQDYTTWQQTVQDEINSHQLRKNKKKLRAGLGIFSILLIPLIIVFAVYELFAWMSCLILLFFGYMSFALLYRPRTMMGRKIKYQWKSFENKYKQIGQEEWKEQMADDQKRAFIYGIGMNHKEIKTKNKQLIPANPSTDHTNTGLFPFLLLAAASHNFADANNTVSASSPSGTPGGGAGIGGGGGGSGAF